MKTTEREILMYDDYHVGNKIKDLINGQADADRERKASMKGNIDKADDVFQFFLLLFGLGFWVVMILKLFL